MNGGRLVMTSATLGLGDFGDERLAKTGVCCARDWWRARIYLRHLAGGRRSGIVGFSRFLANPRVTVAALFDGWGAAHTPRCEGRHVLAIQDSSDLDFKTTRERSRGLGEIGKGSGRAVFCGTRCWVWVPGRAAFRAWARAGYGGRISGPDMDTRRNRHMAG